MGHPLKRGNKLKGTIYGNYFLDVPVPNLHEASTIEPDVLSEWDMVFKHTHQLSLNYIFQ